jgi:hypothetical protein
MMELNFEIEVGMVIRKEEEVWVQDTTLMSMEECQEHLEREFKRYPLNREIYSILSMGKTSLSMVFER